MSSNRNNTIKFLIAVAIFCGVYYLADKEINNRTAMQDSLQHIVDSMYKRDVTRNQQIGELLARHTVDSLYIVDIRKKLDSIPAKITSTKKKYNDKRNHINNAPVDSQISYLSEWLSEDTSTR